MTHELATVPPRQEISLSSNLPLSLRVITDQGLYDRMWAMAQHMAKSPGLVGAHLLGNPDACFSVIVMSLEFKLNPYMVARNTFSPGKVKTRESSGRDLWLTGNIGFQGKLVHAICNASGRMSKPIEVEYFGDWDKISGAFEMVDSFKEDPATGEKRKFAKPSWAAKDEEGLGVVVKIYLKEEDRAREFTIFLKQAQPRNSTLWATDPKTQMRYLAIRRAVDSVAPEILLGIPFEDDLQAAPVGPDHARNVTPVEPDPLFEMLNGDGAKEESPAACTPEETKPCSLHNDNGEVFPPDRGGLERWQASWTTAFRDPKNNPSKLMEQFVPALSDAAVLFDSHPQMVKHIEKFGDWARQLTEQAKQVEGEEQKELL